MHFSFPFFEKISERKDFDKGIWRDRRYLNQEPLHRMVQLIANVENPYAYHMEGYQVNLEWSSSGKTIQDCVRDVLKIT